MPTEKQICEMLMFIFSIVAIYCLYLGYKWSKEDNQSKEASTPLQDKYFYEVWEQDKPTY